MAMSVAQTRERAAQQVITLLGINVQIDELFGLVAELFGVVRQAVVMGSIELSPSDVQ